MFKDFIMLSSTPQLAPALTKTTLPTELTLLDNKPAHIVPAAHQKTRRSIEIVTIPPLSNNQMVHLNIGIETSF